MTYPTAAGKIVLMAAHWRDIAQMLDTLERTSYLDASNVVAIIREPTTLRSQLQPGTSPSGVTVKVLVWPSTNHGTSLDGGVLIEAKRIGRFVERKIQGVDEVIVGDFHGEPALVAQYLARKFGARLTLLPEGVGVFRIARGEYPWVIRSWKSAIGLIASDTAKEISERLALRFSSTTKRRWHRKLRLFWRISRVVNLAVFRPAVEQLRPISRFDSVISHWPRSVTDLFRADQVIAIDPPWDTGSPREIPQLLGLTGNVALVIHQSERLSIDQWVEVLTPLQEESVETYVVKPDRYRLDLDAFCGALALVAPTSTVIILESDLPAEVVATSWDFAFVAGVTSTTLTNLALEDNFTAPLISLVYSCFAVIEPEKEQVPPEDMTWGFAAVAAAKKLDRISFR
jgi:hypothetical protein